MPLADTATHNAKPDAKPLRLFDVGGVSSIVLGARRNVSRLAFTRVSLKDTRERRDATRKPARKALARAKRKKAPKATDSGAGSSGTVAREWRGRFSATRSETRRLNLLLRLDLYLSFWLGELGRKYRSRVVLVH